MKKQIRSALAFIILMGFVSLFSDIVYEGARSIAGQFLGLLGASAAAVALVAGLGEFIGYSFRLVSGYLADRTKKYWLFTLIGYGMNLFAIPMLALVGNWQLAFVLLIAERFGKALRKPARDTMMSYAAKQVGSGFGFGLEEALDQIGAVAGPVFLSLVLALKSGEEISKYRFGFAILFVPAAVSVALLIIARILFPAPSQFEKDSQDVEAKGKFSRKFIWYLIAICLIAAGFADFPFIAFHVSQEKVFAASLIPILYALAMGVDAAAALVFGKLYDKFGVTILMVSSGLTAMFAPLVFLTKNPWVIAVGISLWGIGMGAQESILKAVVADIVPKERRGTAYGIFNTLFGLAWFLGSFTMGILYGISIVAMVVFSIMMEVFAIVALTRLKK
ncbi:major facilitator superfamily MFS_1 [Pseudothermotoga thermarum DSM 5069]|uniref:Major facilitator superfamily MFS_1 n=1 Tax=Pseudothermotoga thermarum DSM 5069 TaxID=688269 RepID=F7YXV6_9THEM|nr:major facilitator superfamily MFS_1 [Pseudothermotoga thermarum DSM 5069]